MTATKPPRRTSDDLLAELKTLHPQLIDLSLDRIAVLLARLGHPEKKLPPVVHIAGTNGKGSTTAFLKAMAEGSGLRVHVYTSPHLVRFHERISIPCADGVSRPIAETQLVDLLSRVAAINGRDPMTFFEITTAAAFLAFAETPADLVILETGLGGNFDATNVVARPAMSVITPISMDHADKLGNTLVEIATTKAGILKPDAPAVIGPQEAEVLDTIRARARVTRSPMVVWGEDYDAFEQTGGLVFQSETEMLDLPLPALIGPHQIVNAGIAVAAATQLRAIGLTDAGIAAGLQSVTWPARMQRLDAAVSRWLPTLPDGTELWLDGGHNPAGARVIAETLASLEERSPKPLYLVVGMMGQKDAEGFLSAFTGQVAALATVPIPGAHERPFEAPVLASIARGMGYDATSTEGVPEAVQHLLTVANGPARILICGSLYLAGHVLTQMEPPTQE